MHSNKIHRVVAISVVKHDYLPRAVAAHPNFELVAVADDDAAPPWVHERNQLFAEEFRVPYVRDIEAALRDFVPGVAVISSEVERHCDLGVRAAEAGLHVILDKPLSTRMSECDRLVDAVSRNKVKSLIWNRNYLPALRHAKSTLDEGRLGKLMAIHCDFYFSKDAGPAIGNRGPNDSPIPWLERQIEAHTDGSDGGVGIDAMGELQVEGIYPLAYIKMLTGLHVERTFARATAHFHQAHADNDVDDLATVTLEMEQGVVGSLCIGRIGAASHPDIGEIKLRLVGTEGALVVSEPRPEVAIYYRDQPPLEFKNRRIADQNNHLLMEEFARVLQHGGTAVLDAVGARNIAATVAAALESSRSGQVVSVDNRLSV